MIQATNRTTEGATRCHRIRSISVVGGFLDGLRLDLAVAEPDAVEELLQVLPARLAGHEVEVRLFDAVARVGEGLGEVAVVGQ